MANIDFLRMATNARRKALGQPELDPLEFYAFVMPRVRSLCGVGGVYVRLYQRTHTSGPATYPSPLPPTATQLSMLNMDPAFLNRSVNEGFSGGEKKRNEILQLACLEADCAILDEIDSGLDIDALRDVANAVNALKKERPDSAIIMVTHYKVERGAGWTGCRECLFGIGPGGSRCHGVLKLGWKGPRCMIEFFWSFAEP